MTYSPLSTYDIDRDSPIGQIMLSKGIEFEEAFWLWFDSLGIPSVIINGYCYGYEETTQGYRSQRYLIIPSERKIARIRRFWRIGKTDRPDTARFLSKEEYLFHSERTRLCKLKGCFDRYECYWYDLGEEAEGPWNSIPDNWHIGDEQCESFLSNKV